MALFLIQVLNGLQFGVLLFLIAAGLTLVFGVMNFINLAHGTQYMLGAYLAVAFYGLVGTFMGALGLALVTAVAVLAQGLRVALEGDVKAEFKGDYVLTSVNGFTPTSIASTEAVRRSGAASVVAGVRAGQGRAFGIENDQRAGGVETDALGVAGREPGRRNRFAGGFRRRAPDVFGGMFDDIAGLAPTLGDRLGAACHLFDHLNVAAGGKGASGAGYQNNPRVSIAVHVLPHLSQLPVQAPIGGI